VTAAAIDHTCKFLAVGSCAGEAKVLNLKSGGVLYDLPKQDKEITCVQFLNDKTEFWIVAGCWNGKIILFTKPTKENYFRITAKARIGHRGDVLALSCSKLIFISGGTDTLLSVWNSFTGVMKHRVTLPDPKPPIGAQSASNKTKLSKEQKVTKAGRQLRKTIVGLAVHPYFRSVIFVL
jgi:WD40 repeat protein